MIRIALTSDLHYDPDGRLTYFGPLTTGEVVARFPQVRVVVSGHTHCGRRGEVHPVFGLPIDARVIDSNYVPACEVPR